MFECLSVICATLESQYYIGVLKYFHILALLGDLAVISDVQALIKIQLTLNLNNAINIVHPAFINAAGDRIR